jgi:hypothetical protein
MLVLSLGGAVLVLLLLRWVGLFPMLVLLSTRDAERETQGHGRHGHPHPPSHLSFPPLPDSSAQNREKSGSC